MNATAQIKKSATAVDEVRSLTQMDKSVGECLEMYARLTRREKEVARLMTMGHSNRAIANRLGISVKTLDIHRANIKYKFEVDNAVKLCHIMMVVCFAGACGNEDE